MEKIDGVKVVSFLLGTFEAEFNSAVRELKRKGLSVVRVEILQAPGDAYGKIACLFYRGEGR